MRIKISSLKKISHRVLIICLITVLVSSFSPQVALSFAQEINQPSPSVTPIPTADFQASSSAQVEPTTSPSPTPTLPPPDQKISSSPLPSTAGASSLFSNPVNVSSATIQGKSKVHELAKHVFRADEKITVIVDNALADGVKVSLYDVDGREVNVEMEKVSNQDPAVLEINPPRQFKAGRYRLVVTDPSGDTTTQDFTWGVLAINPNKSIYLPDETANLAMAVLDETGMMVCDAEVELKITNKDLNINDTLSTQNGSIVVNPDCSVKAYTLKPDYEANYKVQNAGFYEMTLTAKTKNGTYSITDGFDVRGSVPFDVERVSATRIFPPVTYSSIFNLTANQDFEGTITETVPDTFAISKIDGVLPFDQEATVSAKTAIVETSKEDIPHLSLPYEGNFAISQKFGSEIRDPLVAKKYADYGLAGHDGIDFDLPEGTPVLAADDGQIVRADENGDYGKTVIIQHSWGRSYYGHLSQITAKIGQQILRGYPMGMSGSTGMSTGPHLHFGIKPNKNDPQNGYYGKINPMPYLGLESYQSDQGNIVFSSSQPESSSVKTLTWNVSLKKGDKLKLGYGYKVPNVSPQFYLLGPLQFTNKSGQLDFQETRQWQLAADVVFPATSYLSATASTVITGTVSWQLVTSAPAGANNTTSCKVGTTTGYCQETPGAANTTNGQTIPTVPNGRGWIYDTVLNSTIPTGTWTFNVRANSSNAITGTGFITVCAWKVTVSAGAIASYTNFINCVDGTTNVQTGVFINLSITVTSVAAQSFTSSQYLYVEYWVHTTVASGGANDKVTFVANGGATEDIVTPNASSNLAPNAPSQDSPTNSATNVSTTPVFKMTATDPETNNLQYKVTIYSNSGCTTTVQTNDQSVSQTGWSGQNATCVSGSDCYTSGTQGIYTTQTALSNSTQYWWKASAMDPSPGSTTFTDSSTCNTFTTQSAGGGPTLDQLLRHGEWFNSSGARQPFTF